LGFVVNELVTNAIKYAFPIPAEGEISVAFSREPEGFLLRVADGGKGIPASVETKGTGLGMRLVSAFVAQVGGTLDIRRSPGVEYVIRVPTRAPLP
jgi:two-component sensor histidine kinase